ncbi:hypothetical protein Patl1_35727 [Pistacia atlantica]|nr:hypothetical protein Patl1_35727 [Pistacia atlantica]
MEARRYIRLLWRFDPVLLISISLVIFNSNYVNAEVSDIRTIRRELKADRPWYDKGTSMARFNNDRGEEDIDIIATYSDVSGAVRIGRVKKSHLSASWILESPSDGDHDLPISSQMEGDSSEDSVRLQEKVDQAMGNNHSKDFGYRRMTPMSPVKLKRQERRELRTAQLIQEDKENDDKIQATAFELSRSLEPGVMKYSIWRRDFESPNSDSTLKLMRDQIILAKAYAHVALANNESSLYKSLMQHCSESQHAIGDATSDAELHPSALDRAKTMGHVLSVAKDRLYDCPTVQRKLRTMIQSTEDTVSALKKKSSFLIQLAAKIVPRPLHCLPLQLAADYFMQGHHKKEDLKNEKFEDPSLYHYAIFSDNVLATSVVVNSTVLHAKEPEKHVFHVVTDKLNFAAMKMWFLVNAPAKATIQVENIDDFKWLNSSYCSVLRQLESARLKEYYFKANHPSSLSAGLDNLKYRNPKYLSMLNHLRFYLPEVYPKLDKILFLDDDIVVQKDLTPLWSIDLHGMVNGAVETCKESFHRFDKYLNFSNPKILENFDANACGWAFGMNMFDLKEWKKRNITGIYHYWQDLNEDRTLWKLGSLPPGLITFYNLTYPLDRNWHVLGLGYDPALNLTEIENGAVVHYNGNYKPWLDLAVTNLLRPKLHSWSFSIKELTSNGKWQDAFYQFYEMKHAGAELTDPSVFPLILKACSNLSRIHGKSLHACLIKQGFASFTSIGNALMDFYMKCRFMESARTVFGCMSRRDSVSWNIMIHGHLDRGGLGEGLWWFYKARIAGFEPNTSILVLVIQACRTLGAYCEGLEVHGYLIRSGFWAIHSVQNSLLRMYVDVDMVCARRLFDEMSEKDVISWSVVIVGYVLSKDASSGLQLFQKMVSDARIEPDGVTAVSVLKGCANSKNLIVGRMVHGLVVCRGLDCDLFVGNSLIDMYSKCEDTDSAFKVFNEMHRKNNVSWNSILSGFVLNAKYSEALSLIYSMGTEENEVDEITLVNILQVCKYFVRPIECKSVHCVILRMAYESNAAVINSLVDAYAKCYVIEVAWELFSAMKRRDVVSWSTMIAGFTHCGMPDEAISVFQEMNQTQEKPNAVTIINLLEACSVTAELRRSKWAHGIAIRRGLAAEVAVGTAIVDMYSKCGAIEASRKAFDQISHKNIVSWSAMVAAYGVRVIGGYSLVHVDNKACKFVAGDKSHPQACEIDTVVKELHSCVKIDERDQFLGNFE